MILLIIENINSLIIKQYFYNPNPLILKVFTNIQLTLSIKNTYQKFTFPKFLTTYFTQPIKEMQ